MANPRYPHTCVIYRSEGATSFNPKGTKRELYSGMCRKSTSDNIRTFNTGSNNMGKVDTIDYRVSFPGIVAGIQKGDLVDVTDKIGTETAIRVVMVEYSEIGEGGTAVICNSPSN